MKIPPIPIYKAISAVAIKTLFTIYIDGKAHLTLKCSIYHDLFCLFKIAQESLEEPHIIFSAS